MTVLCDKLQYAYSHSFLRIIKCWHWDKSVLFYMGGWGMHCQGWAFKIGINIISFLINPIFALFCKLFFLLPSLIITSCLTCSKPFVLCLLNAIRLSKNHIGSIDWDMPRFNALPFMDLAQLWMIWMTEHVLIWCVFCWCACWVNTIAVCLGVVLWLESYLPW